MIGLGLILRLVENGWVPDALVRRGIRRLCAHRLDELAAAGAPDAVVRAFADDMRRGPVAPVPEKANEQHYELPAAFFEKVLGARCKYSSCHWPAGVETLDAAEEAALGETCERAGLADGQDVLELGCGWGSLTLWMAERYPASRITAVSNSAPQRAFIEARARARGLTNVAVVTADMNDFDTAERFDRIVSVEMFEHMRNYETLLGRVAGWLRPGGRLFVHVFCHATTPYRFETEGDDNWMGRHFFTGGIMPSADLFERFDRDLAVQSSWSWSGTDYQRTAEAWLENMDARRDEIMPILEGVYGAKDAARWFRRWRVFFLACAELFGYQDGRAWFVVHHALGHRTDAAPAAQRNGVAQAAGAAP